MTTKPSERIVVFVTPAQKLLISQRADSLGISVGELMRRAVLNFDATSEPVRVAGIVDRLRAPKAPDRLDAALRSVAAKAAARQARDAAANVTRNAVRTVKPVQPLPEPIDTDPDIHSDEAEDAPLTGRGPAHD